MSTNINIDVTLQQLQEISNQTRDSNREAAANKTEDLRLGSALNDRSGPSKDDPKLKDPFKVTLAEALNSGIPIFQYYRIERRTGRPAKYDFQYSMLDTESSVPDTYKPLDLGAGVFFPNLGFCHCYYYEEEGLDTKTITVYSADGSSSASSTFSVATGANLASPYPQLSEIDITFTNKLQYYFTEANFFNVATSGSYGDFAGKHIFDNKLEVCGLPYGDAISETLDDTGQTVTTQALYPPQPSIGRKGISGYFSLPINRDSFVLVYVDKRAVVRSDTQAQLNQLLTADHEVYEVTNNQIRCSPINSNTWTSIDERIRVFYSGTRDFTYASTVQDESSSVVVCFLVTANTVKELTAPTRLKTAISRIFEDVYPPDSFSSFENVTTDIFKVGSGAASTIGSTQSVTGTVTVPNGWSNSTPYNSILGYRHGASSRLYAYNLDGDFSIGATPAVYYYLNEYNGESSINLPLSQFPSAFPEANFGKKSNFIYECELQDTELGLKLVWFQRRLSAPRSENVEIPQRLVGKSAKFAFNPGSLGFPSLAVSAFAGDSTYCIEQLSNLGFSESDLRP